MKDYDVIVVGSGAGEIIVEQALIHDLKVALVDKALIDGMHIHPALPEVVQMTIQNLQELQ